MRHLLGDRLDQRAAALRAGLDLIGDAGGERARSVRARLHAALAAAYMLDRRLHEALADGELARSMLAGDRDAAMRCDLDVTVGSVLLFAGRLDEGRELLDAAIARAAAGHLESEAARGYRMLGSSASVLVEYDLAERTLREGIGYADRVERFNDRHYMTAHLAHVLWATGDWTGAEAQARLALADGRDGITTRITALHVLGYLLLGRGATGEARAALSEAAELGAGMRELQRVSPAWWGLAELALLSGDPSAAAQRCEQGYAASARVRDAAYLFPYVVTGTRAHLAASGATAARDWLARTGELLVERRIPGTLGAIDHTRGLIHLHEGQTGKARDELLRVSTFWAGRRRFWEGVAVRLDRARCAYRSRRPGEAAGLAAAARQAWPAELPRVWTAGVSVATPVPCSELSAREMEVARLVAAGNTDRQIAGTLSISPRTAAAHVEHIRVKLGISRRTQIAGWLAKVEPSS